MDFDIKRYQAVLLEMMVHLDNYCRYHNLRYTLAGGSLIGAVRHKGFIPWDDDLDIIMPRPDYEKLLSLAEKAFIDNYSLIHTGNNKSYYLQMAKMIDTRTLLIESEKTQVCPIGINIDIFPLDAIPNDKEKQEKSYKQYRHLLYQAKALISYMPVKYLFTKNNKGRRIVGISEYICHLKNKLLCRDANSLFIKAEKLISHEDYDKANYVRIYTSAQFHKLVFQKEVFDKYTDLDFEGYKLMCVEDYDTYLSAAFKNYMTPPPVEKQVCHHSHYYLSYNIK